jgi:SAM-dependent methyltransferase
MLKFLQNLTNISIIKTWRKIYRLPFYFNSYFKLKKQSKQKGNDFPISCNYPCLLDIDEAGGVASGVYFNQDLYVAQEIFKRQPIKHLDIASRIDGFVAHVAGFRKIEVMDIRKIDVELENITFIQKDLMREDESFHEYCDSLSCLHALEHFGLGRYGDTLDIDGHKKGLKNISKLLKKGGTAYISVPMGDQRIEFNAHRVFSTRYLLNLFEEYFDIQLFSYINDNGFLLKNVTLTTELIDNNCHCHLGCGIFILKKK